MLVLEDAAKRTTTKSRRAVGLNECPQWPQIGHLQYPRCKILSIHSMLEFKEIQLKMNGV